MENLDFSDELFHQEEPYESTPQEAACKPHELYVYERYDWIGFVPDYKVIRLSKGYFTIIDKEDEEKVAELSALHANVSLCPQTGNILKVRTIGQIGKKKIYLHRHLANAATHFEVVDHFNRQPLDNRLRRNLRRTSQAVNLANTGRKSKKGLLAGVEPWGKKFGGQIRFNKIIIRSVKKYDTQEEANAWYLAKKKELYEGLGSFVPFRVDYPVFPPQKKPVVVTPYNYSAEEAALAATF